MAFAVWVRGLAASLVIALVTGSTCASLAAPLERYGALPSLEDISLSPDGKAVAMIRRVGEDQFIIVRSLVKSEVLWATKIGPVKIRALRWAGPTHLLITQSSAGSVFGLMGPKREWFTTQSVDVASRRVENLMQSFVDDKLSTMNVLAGTPMVRTVKGVPQIFFPGVYFVEHTGRNGLFRSNVDGSHITLAGQARSETTGWRVSPDGETLAQINYNEQSHHWTLKVVKSDGAPSTQPLDQYTRLGTPDVLGFDPSGTSLILQLGVEGEGASSVDEGWLYKVGLADKQTPELFRKSAFAENIEDPGTGAIIGGVSVTDDFDTTFFGLRDQTVWTAIRKAYPGEKVHLVSWTDDHKLMVVRIDGPVNGASYALVNLNTGHADPLGDYYDGVGPADLGDVRRITYKAADGLEIPAYLTLPHGKVAKSLPLIVFPHGGPAGQDGPGFDYWAQGMASLGYAVLQPQFRGSTGISEAHFQAGFGQWGRKMQTDLSDGVRALASQGLIDPKRVCIVGGSYGGYAALAGATLDTGVYRCAVSVAGVSDPQRMVRRVAGDQNGSNTSAVLWWDRFMGTAGLNDPAFASIAPVKHVDAITIPVMLIHGKDDTVVDFSQSKEMYDAMKRAGKAVELVTLVAEDHWLSRAATRMQMLQETARFLKANNPAD